MFCHLQWKSDLGSCGLFWSYCYYKCIRSKSAKNGGIDSRSSKLQLDIFRRTCGWNIDSVTITETGWLIMLREMFAVYLENHKKSVNKLCRRSWILLSIQEGCAHTFCCHTKFKITQNILLFASCKDDYWNVIILCTFRVKIDRSQHFQHVEETLGVRHYKNFLL
jgi:hypothetical protein